MLFLHNFLVSHTSARNEVQSLSCGFLVDIMTIDVGLTIYVLQEVIDLKKKKLNCKFGD